MAVAVRPELKLSQPATPKGRRTQQRIIKAGRKVFGADGFVSMRMGDVAAEAGLSMGALYRYFDNKEDLFLAVIHEVHQDLFEASRAGSAASFRNDPYAALLHANCGYITHYYENRAIIRAFLEASMVDNRYRDMWWYMRERHIDRFVAALGSVHGILECDGLPVRAVVEALASLTEQSAYVWFGQENLHDTPQTIEGAAEVITGIWYKAIFMPRSPRVQPREGL